MYYVLCIARQADQANWRTAATAGFDGHLTDENASILKNYYYDRVRPCGPSTPSQAKR